MPGQRIEVGAKVEAALPGQRNESEVPQFPCRPCDGFRGCPTLGLQHRQGSAQIAIVPSVVLPGDVAQQLDRRSAGLPPVVGVLNIVRDQRERSRLASPFVLSPAAGLHAVPPRNMLRDATRAPCALIGALLTGACMVCRAPG